MKTKTMEVLMLPTKIGNGCMFRDTLDNNLVVHKKINSRIVSEILYKDCQFYNLCIISNTKPKTGEWAYDLVYGRIVKIKSFGEKAPSFVHIESDEPGLGHSNISNLRKLEATTDKAFWYKPDNKDNHPSHSTDRDFDIPKVPESFIYDFADSNGKIKNVNVEVEELHWDNDVDMYAKRSGELVGDYMVIPKTDSNNIIIIKS